MWVNKNKNFKKKIKASTLVSFFSLIIFSLLSFSAISKENKDKFLSDNKEVSSVSDLNSFSSQILDKNYNTANYTFGNTTAELIEFGINPATGIPMGVLDPYGRVGSLCGYQHSPIIKIGMGDSVLSTDSDYVFVEDSNLEYHEIWFGNLVCGFQIGKEIWDKFPEAVDLSEVYTNSNLWIETPQFPPQPVNIKELDNKEYDFYINIGGYSIGDQKATTTFIPGEVKQTIVEKFSVNNLTGAISGYVTPKMDDFIVIPDEMRVALYEENKSSENGNSPLQIVEIFEGKHTFDSDEPYALSTKETFDVTSLNSGIYDVYIEEYDKSTSMWTKSNDFSSSMNTFEIKQEDPKLNVNDISFTNNSIIINYNYISNNVNSNEKGYIKIENLTTKEFSEIDLNPGKKVITIDNSVIPNVHFNPGDEFKLTFFTLNFPNENINFEKKVNLKSEINEPILGLKANYKYRNNDIPIELILELFYVQQNDASDINATFYLYDELNNQIDKFVDIEISDKLIIDLNKPEYANLDKINISYTYTTRGGNKDFIQSYPISKDNVEGNVTGKSVITNDEILFWTFISVGLSIGTILILTTMGYSLKKY